MSDEKLEINLEGRDDLSKSQSKGVDRKKEDQKGMAQPERGNDFKKRVEEGRREGWRASLYQRPAPQNGHDHSVSG